VSDRSYGLCPAQLDGFTSDGRPFYFRSRHGAWTLHAGECGWVANICGWPQYGPEQIVARGSVDVEDPDEIDALITEHVGAGWRHATWQEQLFDQECLDCHTVYQSDGSNICTPCLSKRIRGD